MSKTTNARTLYRAPARTIWPKGLKRFVAVPLLLLAGWGVYQVSHRFTLSRRSSVVVDATTAGDLPNAPAQITLTPEKIAAAGIHASPVSHHSLQAERTVPGTLQYDATRYLQLRVPAECVVVAVLVGRGQWVAAGDKLARLNSQQLGLARHQVKKCEADVRIAQLQHEWTGRTHASLTELLACLKQNPSVAELETRFQGKLLGDHRDELISAYSQYLLATSIASRARTLEEQGVMSGRTLEERASQREIAAASFAAACEQSEFSSRHDLEIAAAAVDVAERALSVSRERLNVLLGPHGQESADDLSSEFTLTAPCAGFVEELSAVESARFAEGEPILVLADTRRLWVAAQIHQRDWNSLRVAAGATLTVTVPAQPGRQLEAQVRFVGSAVSPTTLALPLVAELENTEGIFHPGMFVWVSVPLAEPRQALAVPTAAIQRHEGRDFVFVEDPPHTFRRVDITKGIETPPWVEVVVGLDAGARVVDHGAFQLKSVLLLEHEE